MTSRDFHPDDSPIDSRTSRRGLLRTLALAPVVVPAVASPWADTLAALHAQYGDEPTMLVRTRNGRKLSRVRYHRAEAFLPDRYPRSSCNWHDFLYFTGIAVQLGLSAHLLDVGFSDDWSACHIGLRVAKSLAYANATGLGHDCPDMARLAVVLTPYGKWNHVGLFDEVAPDDGGFTVMEVCTLVRPLLDRIHDVTGHPRPNGWRRTREALPAARAITEPPTPSVAPTRSLR